MRFHGLLGSKELKLGQNAVMLATWSTHSCPVGTIRYIPFRQQLENWRITCARLIPQFSGNARGDSLLLARTENMEEV